MHKFHEAAHLWLDAPAGKQLCLQFASPALDDILRFRCIAQSRLPKTLLWFQQCDTANYQMFEFWKTDSPAIETASRDIANRLSLHIEQAPPSRDYWNRHQFNYGQIDTAQVFAFLERHQATWEHDCL